MTARPLRLKGRYRHDDKWTVEPEYNLGNESFGIAVHHQLDSDNRLKAHFDQHSNVGTLEWNSSSLLSSGDTKVKVRSQMTSDALKSMPTISVEHQLTTDV